MKKKWLFIPVACFFLIGVVIGSFCDFQINDALFAKNNIFGITMASFSEIAAYGGLAFLSGALFTVTNKQITNKVVKYIIYVICLAFTLFGIIYQGKAFVSVNAWGSINPNVNKIYFAIPIGLVLVGPLAVWGYFVGKKCENKDIIYVIFAMLFVIVAEFGVIFIAKGIFHRPRFRYLIENDPNLFQNWWVVFKDYDAMKALGLSEEFKSFPSGHTGCASCAMVMLAYAGFFSQKLEKKQTMLFLIGFGYTILVAFSRMTVGAHFLTDVCMSGFITTCAFAFFDVLLDKLVLNKRVKEVKGAE